MPGVEHFLVCILAVSVWALCSGGFRDNGGDRSDQRWPAKMSVSDRKTQLPGINHKYTPNFAEIPQNLSVDLNRETSLRASEGEQDNLNSNLTRSDTAALDISSNRTSEGNTLQGIASTLGDPLHFIEKSRKWVDETQWDILAYFHSIGNTVPSAPADGSVLENAPAAEAESNRGNTHSINVEDSGMLVPDDIEKFKQANDVNKPIINSFMRMGGNRNTNYPLSGQHGNISQFMRHVTWLRESLETFIEHKRVLRSSETKSRGVETEQNATEPEFVYEDRLVPTRSSEYTDTSPVTGRIDTVAGASTDGYVAIAGSVNFSRWGHTTVAKQDNDVLSDKTTISDTHVAVPKRKNYSDSVLQQIIEAENNLSEEKVTESGAHSATYDTASAISVNFINISSLLSSPPDSTSPVSDILSPNGDDSTGVVLPTTTASTAAESSEMSVPYSQFEKDESRSRMPTSTSIDKEFYSKVHKSSPELWTGGFIVTTPSTLDQVSIETNIAEATQTDKTSNKETINNHLPTDWKDTSRNIITTSRPEATLVTEATNSLQQTYSPEPIYSPEPTYNPEPTNVYNSVDGTTSIIQGAPSVQPEDRSTTSLFTISSEGVSDNSVDMGSFTTQSHNTDASQESSKDILDVSSATTASLNVDNRKSSYDSLNMYSFSTQTLDSESQKHSVDYIDSITTVTSNPDVSQTPDDYMDRIKSTARLITNQTSDGNFIDTTARFMTDSQTADENFMDTNIVTTTQLKGSSQISSGDDSNMQTVITTHLSNSSFTQPYHEGYLDTSSSSSLDEAFDNRHLESNTASSATENSTSGLVLKLEPATEHPPTATSEWGLYTNNSTATSKNGAVHSTLPATVAGLDWEAAKQTWSYAWEIHIYVFGCLFCVFGLYTLLSLMRVWWIRCALPSGYFIWLHLLLLVVCFTRSFYLLYDGYGSSGSFHASVNHFLYSFAFPCLTAAFSSLFYWLLQTTRVRLVPPSVQRLQVLVVAIAVHFLISLTTDVLVGFYTDVHIILFVCHAYCITWSLFLFLGYVCIFRKLHSQAVKHEEDDSDNLPRISPYIADKPRRSLTLTAAVKVMLCVAICGLVVTGLGIYAVVEVYRVFTPGRPSPWTWWFYHTAVRMFEVCICLTLIYVISLPRRYHRSGASCSCGILCAPCSEIFCCTSKPKSGICFKHFHKTPAMNSFHNRYKESFTEHSSKELLESQLTDKIHPVQPIFGSRPNSLLIIEDGYVRFQTEYDINKIVDSCNDLSQRPVEDHAMGTFLSKDGVLNTGYTLNPGEDSHTRDNSDTQASLTNKSRNSSATNSDYFRVPSSVSLADSIENELEKAFMSFKMDTSTNDDSTSKATDLTIESDVQNVRSNDAVKIVSRPNSRTTAEHTRQIHFQQDLHNETDIRSNDQNKLLTSQHKVLTLPSSAEFRESNRTAKGSGSLPDANIQMKLTVDTPTCDSDPPDASHLHLLDVRQTHQADSSEDSDYDSECNFPISSRRPSEGQGCQAALLTSFLRSWETEPGENIDV